MRVHRISHREGIRSGRLPPGSEASKYPSVCVYRVEVFVAIEIPVPDEPDLDDAISTSTVRIECHSISSNVTRCLLPRSELAIGASLRGLGDLSGPVLDQASRRGTFRCLPQYIASHDKLDPVDVLSGVLWRTELMMCIRV